MTHPRGNKSRYVQYDNPGDRLVEVGDATITKIGPPAVIALEVRKTRLAAEIGSASGLFRVPPILDHDADRGRVVYQRVRSVEPCGFLERRLEASPELPERLARILLAIHENLHLPEPLCITLPEEFQCAEAGTAVLHGDFTGRNVMLDKEDGSVLLTDWTTTYRLGELATIGPGWFDLAWFIRWQYLRLGFRPVPRAIDAACLRLVLAYLRESGKPSIRPFGAYLLQVIREDTRRRNVCFPFGRRLAAALGDRALLRFARSLALGAPETGQ